MSSTHTKSKFLKKFSPKKSLVVAEEDSDNNSVLSDSKMQHKHTSQLNKQTMKLMNLSEIHQIHLADV